MDQNAVVLCAANAYEEKYYYNPRFSKIPESIQQELKIICVLFTEEIGGLISFWFDREGNLQITTEAEDGDYLYDEIGSGLMVREIQRSKQELLEELELFYKAIFLGQKVDIQ